MTSDANEPHEISSANDVSLELPKGPITRSRAKQFKEAVTALVNKIWGEILVGHSEEARTNSKNTPCTLLRTELIPDIAKFNRI